MPPSKILVTGATGFIGSRLCERLTLHYRLPYRAFVRRFTKANRIARMGAEMVGGNLLQPGSIKAALEGCDAVVHLAHSDDTSAPKETANLLRASLRAGVRRFVHISSMSVHGPDPGPECAREKTAIIRRHGESYSDSKAKAESNVWSAIRRNGLPAVILRPTVVYGPYSPLVAGVVENARSGQVILIDGGVGVCNAVYVDDVCDAIHSAMTNKAGIGQAFFITGDELITWKDFILAFSNLVEPAPQIRHVASEEIREYWRARRSTVRSNVRALLRLAGSPAFHRELSTTPALGAAIQWAKRKLVEVLSEEQKLVLKSRIQSSANQLTPSGMHVWPDKGRLIRETFGFQFSNDFAKDMLEWRPAYNFQQGFQLTKTWLAFARLIPNSTVISN
jgi:nucleoside-diphosphate-sugar epimerase